MALRNAAGQNWKVGMSKLVRAIMLSNLEYRLHVCSLISESQFVKMNRVLNQALRTAGATAKTSDEAIKFYSGFYSMEGVCQQNGQGMITPTKPLQEDLAQGRASIGRL